MFAPPLRSPLQGKERRWQVFKLFEKKVISGCEGRGDAESPYLTRYTLLGTPWFQLCMHVFHRSDNDELHDHPWDFLTLILKGGYKERVFSTRPHATMLLKHKPGALLYRPAERAHQVILYSDAPKGPGEYREAVTLVLMFKRRREWGFFTKNGKYVHWLDYFNLNRC